MAAFERSPQRRQMCAFLLGGRFFFQRCDRGQSADSYMVPSADSTRRIIVKVFEKALSCLPRKRITVIKHV